MKHIKAFIIIASAFGPHTLVAQDVAQETKIDYRPEISGVIRGRWEMETPSGHNKFAVRNARIAVSGKIAKPIDYYLRSDFCDLGKVKGLDFWMRMAFTSDLKLKVGQFRVPFGYDSFRGPSNYYFANRSFMGRYVANLRAVGASLSYNVPKVPLNVEFGVFNPTSMSDHSVYTDELLYALKAVYTLGDFKIIGGFESLIPDGIRINMYDAAVSFSHDRWLVEGEYIYKHYTNSSFDPCHTYNFFVNYAMPVKLGVFSELSFQGRWDAVQEHSSGVRNAETGLLVADQPERERITLGSQISYKYKKLRCDFRVNYEHYFYNEGQVIPEGRDNKIVAEMIVSF